MLFSNIGIAPERGKGCVCAREEVVVDLALTGVIEIGLSAEVVRWHQGHVTFHTTGFGHGWIVEAACSVTGYA